MPPAIFSAEKDAPQRRRLRNIRTAHPASSQSVTNHTGSDAPGATAIIGPPFPSVMNSEAEVRLTPSGLTASRAPCVDWISTAILIVAISANAASHHNASETDIGVFGVMAKRVKTPSIAVQPNIGALTAGVWHPAPSRAGFHA